MTDKSTVLILGAGIGGIALASRLRRLLPRTHRIALVDRETNHVFASSLLWLMTGDRTAGQITRPLSALAGRGIEVIRGTVERIDPGTKAAWIDGRAYSAEHIVIALGATLAPERIPGLADAGHNFYSLAGAETLRDARLAVRRGRIVVLIAALPFKCPGAPNEAAMLLEYDCRKRGVRAEVQVDLYTPEPGPMPVAGQAVSRALREMIGVSYALKNMSRSIEDMVGRYPKGARMLVYCFRGGKRSKLWFDALSTIGYRVDRLPGGWKAYRAWVRDELTQLPGRFRYHVLCGPTGCGKTRLLGALAEVGAQVLDLEGLASHRGSLIGDIPGVAQPTQKWFDSLLVDKLRRFAPNQPVWVESESKKIGAIQLPGELLQAMHAGRIFAMTAPMSERVKLWREDYSHFERDLDAMMERLRYLRPLIGAEEFANWERLATERRAAELFQRLMEAHYDPAYARSIGKNYPQIDRASRTDLERLDGEALLEAARQLHHEPVTV